MYFLLTFTSYFIKSCKLIVLHPLGVDDLLLCALKPGIIDTDWVAATLPGTDGVGVALPQFTGTVLPPFTDGVEVALREVELEEELLVFPQFTDGVEVALLEVELEEELLAFIPLPEDPDEISELLVGSFPVGNNTWLIRLALWEALLFLSVVSKAGVINDNMDEGSVTWVASFVTVLPGVCVTTLLTIILIAGVVWFFLIVMIK